MNFGKVAVLYGGCSPERKISLVTGQNVLDSLKRQGIDAHPVDTAQQALQKIIDGNFDRAFIALHGPGDEDGHICGALDILGIPYTGSGMLASALSMDKLKTKMIWQNAGLPVLPSLKITSAADCATLPKKMPLPVAIKPNHLGSTLGISCVKTADQLLPAYHIASETDSEVFAEPWITGKEFTVGIIGDRVLPSIQIVPKRGFYDYLAKYDEVATTIFHCPSELDEAKEAEIHQLARQAFDALGCKGWGRVDFMQDQQGKFWLIELNPVPGLTSGSLVPTAARVMGLDYDACVLAILKTSLPDGSPVREKTHDAVV